MGGNNDYDLAIVGGGLAGASLAVVMARAGKSVLVVEHETAFKDRVRGEGMSPWGVVEARTLGILDSLRVPSSSELAAWDIYAGPTKQRRELLALEPRTPVLTFYHPEMQEAMLAAAAAAGVTVRRGVAAKAITPGERPTLTIEHDGARETIGARLVVAADGRTSPARKWCGFSAKRDDSGIFIAGVLLEDAQVPPEAVSHIQGFGTLAILFPQPNGRVRAYYAYNHALRAERINRAANLPHFIKASFDTGVPAEWYRGARAIGPLATFDGANQWVEQPYRDGVALIGDAAASSDPSFGQGLSLTLRDVRVLRDALLANDDWNAAAKAYAVEHDRYFGILHTMETWMTRLFMDVGPEADERRGHVMPRLMGDPTRMPDVLFSGPNHALDETARRRFFAED